MKKTTAHVHPAFALMLAISNESNTPRAFKTDLTVHDSAALSTSRFPIKQSFAWFLFDGGTHLARPIDGDTRSVSRERHALSGVVDFCEGERARCFWWDGLALTEKSSKRVLELLLNESEIEVAS